MFEKKLSKKHRKFNKKLLQDPSDTLAQSIESGLRSVHKNEEREKRLRRKDLEHLGHGTVSSNSTTVLSSFSTISSSDGRSDSNEKPMTPNVNTGGDDQGTPTQMYSNSENRMNKNNAELASDDESDSDESINSDDDSDVDSVFDSRTPAVMAEDHDDIISKVSSEASLWKKKTSLMSHRMRDHRRRILAKFLSTHFLLGIFVIGALSLYWGAIYNYNHYLYRVHALAVIQDEPYTTEDGTVIPSITNNVTNIIHGLPCTWTILNATEFQIIYNLTSVDEIDARVSKLIYDEKFWMALNIRSGATEAFYKSVMENDTNVFNTSEYFTGVYITGRDPTNFKSSIFPVMQKLETIYRKQYLTKVVPEFVKNITAPGIIDRVNIQNMYGLGDFAMNYIDLRPYTNRILLGPLSMGVNYIIMFAVFSISIFGPLTKEMSKYLKPRSLFFMRIIISWSTFFFLSLFTCTVSAIFQIDFTPAFGRAGFIVYWMTSWLTMGAVGMFNENILTLILTFCPSYMSYWLVFWTILNIAPSLYPLALINEFYRFGYAMPIHNGVQIFRVIFLDISKHQMGRNYGILVAWVTANTAINPFVMMFISHHIKKKEAKKEAKREQEVEKERERRREIRRERKEQKRLLKAQQKHNHHNHHHRNKD